MKLALLIVFPCVTACLCAQDEPGGETDRRIMQYLNTLTDADLGKKLKGVRLSDGKVALAGHTLLHRIKLTSNRAHVHVLRDGSVAMGMPTAHAWVEPDGTLLALPDIPAGEPRETAYSMGEVFTSADIHPGDGLIEISCPTEEWIKSLQPRTVAAKWGAESMASVEDPDGETNVRDEDGKVITTVKAGERFLAVKPFEKSAHWEAWLPSGVVGLIHETRIRLLRDEPLMKLNFEPWKAHWIQARADRDAEALESNMKPHPDDYYPTLLRASKGDITALSRFFSRRFEDAPGEHYVRDSWAVLHLAGDDRFAEMFTRQAPDNFDVGAMLTAEWTTAPISDGKKYIERHFPQSSKLLFNK
jgi:hypothetical protein